MLAAVFVVALVVWVVDQTLRDARQIWRDQRQRRRPA
jgi:hypothetical protein